MSNMMGAALLTAGWVSLASAEGVVTYVGYLFGAGALALYYRLWTSTRAVELDKLRAALSDAHATIDRLQKLEITLKNRNDELNTAHARLHGEFIELRGQFSQLTVAFAKQGETVARLMDELSAERKLRDDQFMQWTRERAANGDL